MRAKEGGKETTGETSLRLPSVPFPWSLAVHHQSLAFRARHAKNEAPEEEADISCSYGREEGQGGVVRGKGKRGIVRWERALTLFQAKMCDFCNLTFNLNH